MNEFLTQYGVVILTLTVLSISSIITFMRCAKDKRKENKDEKSI